MNEEFDGLYKKHLEVANAREKLDEEDKRLAAIDNDICKQIHSLLPDNKEVEIDGIIMNVIARPLENGGTTYFFRVSKKNKKKQSTVV